MVIFIFYSVLIVRGYTDLFRSNPETHTNAIKMPNIIFTISILKEKLFVTYGQNLQVVFKIVILLSEACVLPFCAVRVEIHLKCIRDYDVMMHSEGKI